MYRKTPLLRAADFDHVDIVYYLSKTCNQDVTQIEAVSLWIQAYVYIILL